MQINTHTCRQSATVSVVAIAFACAARATRSVRKFQFRRFSLCALSVFVAAPLLCLFSFVI